MATPMFPLGSVILPTMVVPLQIFEPRYRTMMEHLMQSDGKFGSAWIERGFEVGGGDARSEVGTLVHVQKATELADGRWMILGVGLQRIRISEWLSDDPYPIAQVQAWPDSFDGTAGVSDPNLQERFSEAVDKWHGLVTRGGKSVEDLPDLSEACDVGSFQLSAMLPLASQDGYRLLCAPGPGERIELLHEFLDGIDLVMAMQAGL